MKGSRGEKRKENTKTFFHAVEKLINGNILILKKKVGGYIGKQSREKGGGKCDYTDMKWCYESERIEW